MALSSSSSTLCLHSATVVTGSQFSTPQLLFPSRVSFSYFPTKLNNNYQNNRNLSSTEYYHSSASQKWRASVSFFPAFLNKGKDAKVLKEELLEAIAPLDRGAEATPEDQQRVEQIARKLEEVNPTKEPLKSDLLNGKWELIYTTSQSILQTQRPRFLRSVRNYQAINVDTLRAQNLESGPFFNQDRDLGTMIGSASLREVLYYFDDYLSRNKHAQGLSSSISSNSARDQIMLWHLRLGHPSFPYLKYLFPDLFKNVDCTTFQCESCFLSKSHRVSYKALTYCASKPFYLIHSDVWGPSKINTLTGKKWFVTFIDDHTRLYWVYLMREKSEVEGLFKDFYNMVENQFQTKISLLHTDNGTEYFNNYLEVFCKEKGIIHTSTCRDTPQQNGIAERKNHHLLEVSRAIMLSMHVPKYLWGDAVLTACYLINRMPTRVLKYQSPLEYFTLIYPTSRITSNIQLRVFGCTVFVHVPNHLRSKLDPRSEKCVFLGYAPNKKGYKCFNPQTKKFHVSMDVIFLENQPFFGQNSLQGEKENSEDHFWHTSTPMPNMFLPDLGTPTQTQKTDISNNENLGNLELQEPSVNVPETGGEILKDKIPPPELRVYTRKYHHSSKDPLINSIQPQSLPPSTDSSENSGYSRFDTSEFKEGGCTI